MSDMAIFRQPVLDPTRAFGGNFNIVKASVLLCLLSALASPVCSQASRHGCEKLMSTAAKVHCLEQKTLASEAKMSQAFEHALSAYSPDSHQEDLSATPKIKEIVEGEDRLTVAALRESQSEWLSYRSSACSAVDHMYEGGTASSKLARVIGTSRRNVPPLLSPKVATACGQSSLGQWTWDSAHTM
jgi:uncharacterized protein YecT (DUF1311 family)